MRSDQIEMRIEITTMIPFVSSEYLRPAIQR